MKLLIKYLYIVPIVIVGFCILLLVRNDLDRANYANESQPHILYIKISDASKIQETLWKLEVSNYGQRPKILDRNGDTYKIQVDCPPDNFEKIKDRLNY